MMLKLEVANPKLPVCAKKRLPPQVRRLPNHMVMRRG